MLHSRRLFARFLMTLFLFLALPALLFAENWPHWRGPTFSGISTEKNLPTEWSRTKNVAWRVALPGRSGATPVVWENRIFVNSAEGDDLVLLCISTQGKTLWQRKVGEGDRNARGDEGNMASASPTTDGEHVWTMMGTGDIACFDFNGNEVWKFDLEERFGRFRIAFGMHSSPVLWKDRLLLQLIHGDRNPQTQEAVVVALDKATGKTLWKKDRVTGASNENEHSYASPMLWDHGKTPLFITHGADYTIAYDPQTGDEVWRLAGLNPQNDPDRRYHPTLRFVASPGVSENLLVIPTAKNQQMFAIRPTGKGVITEKSDALVWRLPRYTPDVSTPLIHNGLVYLCRKDGTLMCLDAKDGRIIYRNRLQSSRYRASPVYADGNIYATARDGGTVSVVTAGREFRKLADNEMGEDIEASPAISNGTIYIRTLKALWAIRGK